MASKIFEITKAATFDAAHNLPNYHGKCERLHGHTYRIQVTIEAPKVTLKGDDNAVVSFRQKYRSDNLQSNNSKTLVLVRAEGKWKIQQERVGG